MIEFLCGVAIAFAPPLPRIRVWLVPLGFVALAAAGFLHLTPKGEVIDFLIDHENLQRDFVYALPSALIVYGFMQIRVREGVWTNLGDASYMFHPILLLLLSRLWLIVPIQSDCHRNGGLGSPRMAHSCFDRKTNPESDLRLASGSAEIGSAALRSRSRGLTG